MTLSLARSVSTTTGVPDLTGPEVVVGVPVVVTAAVPASKVAGKPVVPVAPSLQLLTKATARPTVLTSTVHEDNLRRVLFGITSPPGSAAATHPIAGRLTPLCDAHAITTIREVPHLSPEPR